MTKRTYTVRRGADLGYAIAEARKSKGLTQAALADLMDIDRSYLGAVECGRSSRLIEHALRALRRLGAEVTITWETPEHQ